jgi:addiction module RelE/StbE family toxin
MFKVKYLPSADRDLTEIVQYLNMENDSMKPANRFLDEFDQAMKRLEYFPHMGVRYTSSYDRTKDYRMIRVGRYLVIYLLKEKYVEIQRIIYEKRNIVDLLK